VNAAHAVRAPGRRVVHRPVEAQPDALAVAMAGQRWSVPVAATGPVRSTVGAIVTRFGTMGGAMPTMIAATSSWHG